MIQQMLAEMSCKVEAARQLVYTAAEALDAGDPASNRLAAQCKYFATETAMEVTTKSGADFWRIRLHARLPGREVHARREDHANLRGNETRFS